MLVLSRKLNESIVIDGQIVVTVLSVDYRGTVRLGIQAPPKMPVHRQEIHYAIVRQNASANSTHMPAQSVVAV